MNKSRPPPLSRSAFLGILGANVRLARSCALAALLTAGGWVAQPSAQADPADRFTARTPVPALNNRDGLASKGYDVVAYFTDGKAVRGNAAYSYKWQGVTWQFASPEHLATFQREQAKYAPQYGGYCAYAVSQGNIVDVDPRQWKIVEGKLYQNANVIAEVLFAKDPAGHIKKADRNWPLIPRKRP